MAHDIPLDRRPPAKDNVLGRRITARTLCLEFLNPNAVPCFDAPRKVVEERSMQESAAPATDERSRGSPPLVSSLAKGPGSGNSSPWRWVLVGCGAALVLTCVCLAAAVATIAFLEQRSATPTPLAAQRPQQTPVALATPRTRPTQPPTNPALPPDWQWFDDPSGQVSLAVPAGWNSYWEEQTCCNVTLVSFDPGQLPTGRIDWAPPGSGGEHEVPPGEVVVDLFLAAPPFAETPPSFRRPPDGEEIVGGRYRAQLYYGAPFAEWPHDQAITYLYQDDQGRDWCLVAYFGTPFDQATDTLAIVTAIVASIQHGG